MKIPTEPIGSIPRPTELINGMHAHAKGEITTKELNELITWAIKDTIERFEATGSPVITDGEQSKSSFVTYPIEGMSQLASNGVVIPFADGHTRQLPTLTGGPFRYQKYAVTYLANAKSYTSLPVKQAVISASALSLLYPGQEIAGYSREAFINDLVNENANDIQRCLSTGAYNVQIDFTEGRLAVKLDPSKNLLRAFVDLNNRVLEKFTDAERQRIGIHTCPGGDHDSTHSADVDYAELLPLLFEHNVTNFYLEFAGEKDKQSVLEIVKSVIKPNQRVFIGVIDVLNPKIESPKEIKDLILEAASYIPITQLGTTDDCGFSPFADDTSTSREIAFEKIGARVEGTRLAEEALSKTTVAF